MKWLITLAIAVLTVVGILLGRRDDPGKAEQALRARREEQRASAIKLNEARKVGVAAEADARRANASARVGDDKQSELLRRIRRYRGTNGGTG